MRRILRSLFRRSQSRRPAMPVRLSVQQLENRSVPSAAPWLAPPMHAAAAGTLSAQDQQFLLKAVQGDQQEMILGSLAATFGGDASVRAFGATLLHDHARLFVNTMPLLKQFNLSLPGPSSDMLQHIQQIASLRGEAFDQAFVSYMVQDHTQDMQNFQTEISQGRNAAVQANAASGLPVIEKHLAIAEALQSAGGDGDVTHGHAHGRWERDRGMRTRRD